jgi:REP element-mobilizing transposase RayT
MIYDLQKHHRRSIRLRGYDYSQAGAYFVTICTHNHMLFFEDDRIRGIAEQCWLEIPRHFQDIELDEWVVMPNHLHGIIIITDARRGTACRAPTSVIERFGKPISGSLPTIIRSFKSAATKRINDLRGTTRAPVWQRNYYEHVIRNEDELNRLRRYILDNPVQWNIDENNPNFQGEPLCQLK